jgi:hypothetical protein
MMIFFDDLLMLFFLGESGIGKKQQHLFYLISLVGDIRKNSDKDY